MVPISWFWAKAQLHSVAPARHCGRSLEWSSRNATGGAGIWCAAVATHDWEWGQHTTYKNGDDWGMVNMTLDPPALGFPEPPNVSLRWISVRFPFFWGSDGRRSPRRVRVSFHIMVTSLQWVWSVADVSTDVRATSGSSSCFSSEPFVGTLVGGWGVGAGFRVSGGWGGGRGVITSCRRPSWWSSWSCNIQHPLSNTLLMLRCGTSSCNI